MAFREIVENWATRWPKERALTQRLRVFGMRRGNTGRNWPRTEPCDSRCNEGFQSACDFSEAPTFYLRRLHWISHALGTASLRGNAQLTVFAVLPGRLGGIGNGKE